MGNENTDPATQTVGTGGDNDSIVHSNNANITPASATLKALITNLDTLQMWTSMPMTTRAEQMRVWNLRNVWTNGIHVLKTTGFKVKDILVYHTQYTNEDGEEVKGPQMVLLSPDGETCRVGSKLFIRQALELMQMFGPPPWPEGIWFHAVDMILDNGNRTYRLSIGAE